VNYRLVEFGILLLILIAGLVGIAVFVGWDYVHDKLRKERKEDESDYSKP
jgi:hypothetical protein